MAAYRRVYDSRRLQADCQELESAPEPYVRQSITGYLYLFYRGLRLAPILLALYSQIPRCSAKAELRSGARHVRGRPSGVGCREQRACRRLHALQG